VSESTTLDLSAIEGITEIGTFLSDKEVIISSSTEEVID